MARFRKKPVIIEAVQWMGDNSDEIEKFAGIAILGFRASDYTIKIGTLEGPHIASLSDWIIKGVEGEFYPCKSAIFEKTYEEVLN